MSALVAPRDELRLWVADEPEADRGERLEVLREPVATVVAAPEVLGEPVATVVVAAPEVQEVDAPVGATLDDVMADAWEALALGAPASCPCCGAPLRPRWSAGSGLVGGRCDGCDARIE